MSNKTLGEVIRYMVERALASDDKQFSAPVRDIYKLVNGRDYPDLKFEESEYEDDSYIKKIRDSREITGLKSSYIYNTTSRIAELRDLNLRAKYEFNWIDGGGDICPPAKFDGDQADKYLSIKLVPGAVNPKAKSKADNEKKQKIVAEFKANIAKVMPDFSELSDSDALVALKAIKEMKKIIEEMN